MEILRRTSFVEYVEQIRPRLEAICENESEPKVIPRIYEMGENPEQFAGMVG